MIIRMMESSPNLFTIVFARFSYYLMETVRRFPQGGFCGYWMHMVLATQDGSCKRFDLSRVRIEANGHIWSLIRDHCSALVWPWCDDDVHC